MQSSKVQVVIASGRSEKKSAGKNEGITFVGYCARHTGVFDRFGIAVKKKKNWKVTESRIPQPADIKPRDKKRNGSNVYAERATRIKRASAKPKADVSKTKSAERGLMSGKTEVADAKNLTGTRMWF